MFQNLKETFSQIYHAKHGERFIRHYQRRQAQEDEQHWKRVLYIMLGSALVMTGLILSIPPGIPGFLLTLPGLGLIAARSKIIAQWLDRSELVLYRAINKLRKKWQAKL